MTTQMVPIKEKAENFRGFLAERKNEIGAALANAGITPDRLLRVVLTSAQKNPKLYECDLSSIYKSVLLCAQSGLLPDGITGQAYLIPYKNGKTGRLEAQLQVGYKGYETLARRTGEITVISGNVVRANDVFDYQFGTDEFLRHRPSADADRGAIVFFYAYARFKVGHTQFIVMTKAEVDLIRARSMAKDEGPWATDYEQMGVKTAIRRLCKNLPQSEDMARLLELDAKAEGGLPQNLDEIPMAEIVPPGEGADAAS